MSLTRFAPAPTGRLHLGHVANAIHVWGLGRRHGAEVLLRIEDHDRQRSRPSYEASILDDLDWLGFRPDRFPTDAFRAGICASRQRDRETIYQEEAARLVRRGLVYACACPRREGGFGEGAAPYPGTCRQRRLPLGDDVRWRLRLEPAVEWVDDLLAGPVRQEPAAQFGDPVIRDRHRNWTYQFAVVVDDFRQGVDFVIRGRDLLASTGLQVQMAHLLGRDTPPRFAHHALVMKTEARKLSKSDGDTGIAALRLAGLAPGDVIGRAAWRVGLVTDPHAIPPDEVPALFVPAGGD